MCSVIDEAAGPFEDSRPALQAQQRSDREILIRERFGEPYNVIDQRYLRQPRADEPTYGFCTVCRTIDFGALYKEYEKSLRPPFAPQKETPLWWFPYAGGLIGGTCPLCRAVFGDYTSGTTVDSQWLYFSKPGGPNGRRASK